MDCNELASLTDTISHNFTHKLAIFIASTMASWKWSENEVTDISLEIWKFFADIIVYMTIMAFLMHITGFLVKCYT